MVLDYLVNTMKDFGTEMEDKAFFGTVLAMMALLFGHPIAAVFIFFFAVC